jgi:general stress protein 26
MNAKQNAEKLHKKVNTFVLTCVGNDGHPLVKAVCPVKHRENMGEIYFCTNTSSEFASGIADDPKASVYFFKRLPVYEGCSLKGSMHIVTDMEIKKRMWRNRYKNAYPERSYTDPDFCVLCFKAHAGRYYRWFKVDDFEMG